MPASRHDGRRKIQKLWKATRVLLVLALAASALQYLENGSITWPGELYRTISTRVSDYATRPSAGWRKASEGLGKLGAQREGQPVPDFDLQGRVVKIMDEKNINGLLVVDDDGKLIGAFNMHDILRAGIM
jgi:hypothetical protein